MMVVVVMRPVVMVMVRSVVLVRRISVLVLTVRVLTVLLVTLGRVWMAVACMLGLLVVHVFAPRLLGRWIDVTKTA